MKNERLTTISEITELPMLSWFKDSCGEDSCVSECEEYIENCCKGCELQKAVAKLHAYEATGFEPEEIEKILKLTRAIIRDSSPFEGDKILCHIATLSHLMAVIAKESQ